MLLSALETSAHARDTIIVFWSDNGWHLGEKQHWHKSTLWQRSTHVPVIVWAPGMREPGRGRPQPVNLLDIYPTLIDLCGLPRRRDLDGSEPRAAAAAIPGRSGIRPSQPTWNGNHSVRDERWRYIRYADGGEELYDCVADPNEWRNLAAGANHDRIKQELGRWIPKTSAAPKPVRADYDFDFATYQYRLKKPI